MATFFLDLEGGNDANDGTTFANRWKTFTSGATAARIAPGDTIRVMASPDETSIGNATWTQGSKTVTLAAACTVDVDACESAWTAATNVTASLNTSSMREGASCVSLAIAAAFTTGKAGAIQRVDDAAAAGAHRYWRILVNAIQSGAYVSIVEMEMRESIGGADATGSGTAAASSTYTAEGATAAKAFDNVTTYPGWTNNADGAGCWLSYDFGLGVTKQIVEVTIRVRNDGFYAQAPTAFSIQWSDDNSSWTTSWSASGLTYTQGENKTNDKPTTATSPINLSGYQQVSFWFQANATLAAGVLSLRLCSDTAGATTVDTLLLPAYPCANVWQCMTINKGSALGSSINSVALYAESDPGTVTCYLDNIIACKAVGSADSLTLDSLIGKVWNRSWVASTTYSTNDIRIPTSGNRNGFRYKATTGGTTGSSEPTWPEAVGLTVTDGSAVWTCEGVEDTWYPIQSIRATTVLIDNGPNRVTASGGRGYYGETETVATYKREPIGQTPGTGTSNTTNEVTDTGTVNTFITYSGGWDRTAMSSQSGQTWLSGRNGRDIAVGGSNNLQMNWALNGFGFTRYYYGSRGYSTTMAETRYYNTHFVGLDGIPLHAGQGAVSIYAKGLAICNSGDGTYSGVMPNSQYVKWDISRFRIENGMGNGVYPYFKMRLADGYIRNHSARGLIIDTACMPDLLNVKFAGNATSDIYDQFNCARLQNCLLGSSTTVEKPSAFEGCTTSGKDGQTANNHLQTFYGGTIVSATDQRHTASGVSWKFRPTNTARGSVYPLVLSVGKLAVTSSTTYSVTIWTRRDNTNIKGRFRLRGGQLGGVAEQIITCEPSINTWTQSSAITFTPTEDGIVEVEFAVYDGVDTTNNYWIDDLTVA